MTILVLFFYVDKSFPNFCLSSLVKYLMARNNLEQCKKRNARKWSSSLIRLIPSKTHHKLTLSTWCSYILLSTKFNIQVIFTKSCFSLIKYSKQQPFPNWMESTFTDLEIFSSSSCGIPPLISHNLILRYVLNYS